MEENQGSERGGGKQESKLIFSCSSCTEILVQSYFPSAVFVSALIYLTVTFGKKAQTTQPTTDRDRKIRS